MKKTPKEPNKNIVFTSDNVENMREVIGIYKNILICGIKGVGKITNTVQALEDKTNIYYIGNPVDFEGKSRPGSYEKYINYIVSLKKDIKTIDDINTLFNIKHKIILIIDEIYGRSGEQLVEISRLYRHGNDTGSSGSGLHEIHGPLNQ